MENKEFRHNAVEKLLEIRSKYAEKYTFVPAVDDMFNEMCGAIFNLRE